MLCRIGGESTNNRSCIRPPPNEVNPGHHEPAQLLTGDSSPQCRLSSRIDSCDPISVYMYAFCVRGMGCSILQLLCVIVCACVHSCGFIIM